MKNLQTTETRRLALKTLSFFIALSVVFICFSNVTVHADSTATSISYSENYSYLEFEDLEVNELMYSEISVSNPKLSLSIVSQDTNVVRVSSLEPETDKPGYYLVTIAAVGEGGAKLTITASDGTIDNMQVSVHGTLNKDYTIQSDTNNDFTIPQNGSYFIKMNYTYTGPGEDPTMRAMTISGYRPDCPLVYTNDSALTITPVSQDGNTYIYRIDASGNVGESAELYAGSYNYPTHKICKITVASAPKDIHLDTTGMYVCNRGDTYRFVAYTNSATPPQASANNDLVSVSYIGKVSGGYEYRMTAQKDKEGSSLVRVTSGGETVSFPVLIDDSFEGFVDSDTHQTVSLAKGESYTYKFTIMGGGEPSFAEMHDGVIEKSPENIKLQLVKKDGLNYYVKVTAISGNVGDESGVCVSFPNSIYYDPNSVSGFGTVQIKSGSAPVVMQADTNSNFTLPKGGSYTFKITGASSFVPGISGAFDTTLVRKSGNDSFYKITAIGQPGQQVGFYMSNGAKTQKVCIVTVGAPAPIVMQSDTSSDFMLAKGESYIFKISGATSFVSGTPGVFKTVLVNKSGNDSYYKITALGNSGSSSGFYMSAPGQKAKRVCMVTIAKPGSFISDTTSNFTIPLMKTYTIKITAPGAKTVSLFAGSSNTFDVISTTKSGDNFYFTIKASGLSPSDKSTGIYVSVDGRSAQRICIVTLAAWVPVHTVE